MKQKKKLEMVATTFCASVEASGKIENWVTDNVIGILITPTFHEAEDQIALNLGKALNCIS